MDLELALANAIRGPSISSILRSDWDAIPAFRKRFHDFPPLGYRHILSPEGRARTGLGFLVGEWDCWSARCWA